MHDLLSDEPEAGKLFEWLKRHRDDLAAVAERCKASQFHETSEPRRAERIAEIDANTALSPEEKAKLVWWDFLAALCAAPSFVPPISVTIANMPIIMRYLDAALAAQ